MFTVPRSIANHLLQAAILIVASTPALASPSAHKDRAPLSIDSSVTIIESQDEPAPVRRATEDLVSDFSKVFGTEPNITDHLEDSGQIALLISGPNTPDFASRCKAPTGAESFAFSVVHLGGHRVRDMICLRGADMRGTIYAIYHF